MLIGIVVPAAALLAFRGQPREVGDVSAHPRFRTVDEETGLKAFIGVKVETSSPDVLLKIVDTLAEWVKAAKRDATDARRNGDWDVVHDIELVVGHDAMHMTAAEFAQYVHDLRYRELGPRERGRIIGGP